jgi:hypothetical protein
MVGNADLRRDQLRAQVGQQLGAPSHKELMGIAKGGLPDLAGEFDDRLGDELSWLVATY